MNRKVVVHSNAKRFVQVIGIAIIAAAALTGLKKASQWWLASSSSAAQTSALETPEGISGGGIIVGQSTVIDADTLEIHGQRVRLEGIDAPEAQQRCGGEGSEWPCGQQAALALGNWIADRPVSCHPRGSDRYHRVLARCFVGNDDMQAWLVSNGWALAYRRYSDDYETAENHARSAKAGMWRSEFVPPWEWRQQAR